jgi:hypothetical protein
LIIFLAIKGKSESIFHASSPFHSIYSFFVWWIWFGFMEKTYYYWLTFVPSVHLLAHRPLLISLETVQNGRLGGLDIAYLNSWEWFLCFKTVDNHFSCCYASSFCSFRWCLCCQNGVPKTTSHFQKFQKFLINIIIIIILLKFQNNEYPWTRLSCTCIHNLKHMNKFPTYRFQESSKQIRSNQKGTSTYEFLK